MTKFVYLVLLAAVVWGVRGYDDDHDDDLTPDTNENNREIKCGKYYAQYPNFEDCSTYIVCQNGMKTIKSCPSGQHYNDRTIRCEEPCEAYCNKTLSCECKWSTCGLDDVCFLPQIVGGCRERIPRFYFNKRTGKCERFGYSGCRGNENNFQTKDDCEQKCKKRYENKCPAGEKHSDCSAGCQKTCKNKDEDETCLRICEPGCICKEEGHVRGPDGKCIPSDECKADSEAAWFQCLRRNGLFPYPNNCRAFFQCYNFRPALRLCPPGRHFSYSSQRCERPCDAYCATNLACRCKWPTCGLDDRCSLLPETGPCRAAFRNYYFNRTSGQCELFVYGGCDGNPNNFLKKEDCERACPAKKEEDCPYGEAWNDCKPCEKTCDNVEVEEKCEKRCVPGCVCDEPGTVRGPDGTCIAPPLCPERPKPKPIPSFHCPSMKEGLYPNEDNCRTYFQCSNGDPSLMACPSGLHYSYQTQRCEQPCDAHCDKSLACECKWPTCDLPDRCSLLPEVGPCRAGMYPFYFNRSTGVCETFLYGGCRGNENNFKTKDECEKTCSKGDKKSCPAGEEWSECSAGCQTTCETKGKEQPCLRNCKPGCICKEKDHVRGPDGKCIPSDECKGDEESCPSFEVWNDCKPCEKTCDNVNEDGPCTQDCVPGCVCDEPGTVRGPNGTCIAPPLCPDKPKPNPSFHCPSLKEGLYPNEDNCTTFFECSNGEPSLMACPSGLHYSFQTQRCEQPCDAHCDKSLACECKWSTCGLPDRCSLLPEVGPCRAGFYPFYFNRSTGVCETFLYGGCRGNENNFKTKDECEKTCSKDEEKKCPPGAVWSQCDAGCQKTCENVAEDKPCNEGCVAGCVCEEPGHVKDAEGNCVAPPTCQSSEEEGKNCPSGEVWSECDAGCQKTCQNVNTEVHCKSSCVPGCVCKEPGYVKDSDGNCVANSTCTSAEEKSLDICKLPPKTGVCKGRFPRYYFDPKSRKCETFLYGGCKGNLNNFRTLEECKDSCLKKKHQRAYPLLGCGPGNSYWGNRDDCSSYFYCRGDGYETQLLHCPSGQHFNNALGRCTAPCDAYCEPSLACECGWPNCNKKSSPLLGCVPANDTWGNVEDCSTYFYCKGDKYETELVHCPNGKHYSPSLKRCMAPCDAYCEPSIACECKWPTCNSSPEKSTKDFICIQDGLFKNPKSSNSYIHCVKGYKYEMPCPTGYQFNEKTKHCEEPSKGQNENAPSTLSPCNLPADKGPCNGSKLRWFYNPSLRSCGRFMYGGCKGNGNNFMLERDCLATCKGKFSPSEEICRLPAEKGVCKGHFEKYYFDHQEGKCTKFIYGGCGGNQNNFGSQEECERSCLKTAAPSEEICRLPAEKGVCKGHFEKYYFDHQEGKCTKFIYGGCGGNQNNFGSQEECEMSCLKTAAPKKCKTNSDCSNKEICRSNAKQVKVCMDGCSDKPCGKNAICSVNNHRVVCSCPPDFIGDPHDKKVGCKPRRQSTEPECAEDGLRSDFESCRRYIRCSSGERETVYCPPGLHYNEANQQCDSPCDARCDMSLAMECGWPVSAAEFECPSPDGKFPYPDNDRKYIRCRNNISTIEECKEDQKFDYREKECV